MPKKKQKFIDKKKAVSFRLVHRSQRDPLAADDSAPQHVLQPLEAPKLNPEERRKEQVKYGVYYDDDYDYMQHMRSIDEYHNVHLSAPISVHNETCLIPVDDDDPEGLTLFRKTPRGLVPVVKPVSNEKSKSLSEAPTTRSETLKHEQPPRSERRVPFGGTDLPASAFASQGQESKVGLINRG